MENRVEFQRKDRRSRRRFGVRLQLPRKRARRSCMRWMCHAGPCIFGMALGCGGNALCSEGKACRSESGEREAVGDAEGQLTVTGVETEPAEVHCRAEGAELEVSDRETLERLRGCEVFEGRIRIEQLEDEDLSALADLRQVQGELTLEGFDAFSAFVNLRQVRAVSLNSLSATSLQGLFGLSALDESGAALEVRGCNQLIDLSGLEALQVSSLNVADNARLRTLRGPVVLRQMQDILVRGNQELTTLWAHSGADGRAPATVEQVRTVEIANNPKLLDVAPLTHLTRAQEVRLSGLPELPTFSGLVEVSTLEVQYNRIQTESGEVSAFPALRRIVDGGNSGFLLIENPGMTSFHLPSLEEATSIWIRENENLAAVSLPQLEAISSWLLVHSNPSLPESDFHDFVELANPEQVVLCGNLGSAVGCDGI